jgi:hypothetical protein
MVRIQTDLPYTSLWREVASQWRAPLGSYPDRHCQRLEMRREKAHLAVHLPSACSGVKALRNTSAAKRQAAKLCYRFGPLTPSARSANLIAGDGTKNGPSPLRTRNRQKNQNNHLTGKAPYKSVSRSILRLLRREEGCSRRCAVDEPRAARPGCCIRNDRADPAKVLRDDRVLLFTPLHCARRPLREMHGEFEFLTGLPP